MTPERMIHSQITIFKMQQMIQVTKTTLTEDITQLIIDNNMKRFVVKHAGQNGLFQGTQKKIF